MRATDITDEVFNLINKNWALVTAGTIDSFNTMTIAWGCIGALWVKPVVIIFIKPIRHTYKYLEENEYFTLSFFADCYKNDLVFLGNNSGKNIDKLSFTHLTACECENSVTFREAESTLICKKIYSQDLDKNSIPPEYVEKYYQFEQPHRCYVGEIVKKI